MTDYVSFFLNTDQTVLALNCLEISHPTFDSFYYCAEISRDTSINHEDFTQHTYKPKVMRIDRRNVSADLDQTIAITIGDVDSEFMKHFENIRKSEYPRVRPSLKFRMYRNDDLINPLVVLPELEIKNISKDGSGNVTFQAQAQELNSVSTGEIYTLDDYPSLRGSL